MRKANLLIWFLISVLILASCKEEDDYVYPSVFTEILCAQTDATGAVSYLNTDDGKVYRASNGKALKGLARDSVYRVYCVYELSESMQDEALLYSFQPLVSPNPIKANRFPGGVKTDPLKVVSVWRGGAYINLSLEIMSQDTRKHRFHFVDGGITEQGEYRSLNLTLYYDRGGDVEAYYQKVYLSMPLENYKKVLQPGDLVLFHINTFSGFETYRLVY